MAWLTGQAAGGVLAGSGGSWALRHVASHRPLSKMSSVVVSGWKLGESRPSAQGPAQIWCGSLLHRILLVEVRPIPVDLGHHPSPPSVRLAWGGVAGLALGRPSFTLRASDPLWGPCRPVPLNGCFLCKHDSLADLQGLK